MFLNFPFKGTKQQASVLDEFGYCVRLSDNDRHRALNRAIKKLGQTHVQDCLEWHMGNSPTYQFGNKCDNLSQMIDRFLLKQTKRDIKHVSRQTTAFVRIDMQ
jgi:hypothetical protein